MGPAAWPVGTPTGRSGWRLASGLKVNPVELGWSRHGIAGRWVGWLWVSVNFRVKYQEPV